MLGGIQVKTSLNVRSGNKTFYPCCTLLLSFINNIQEMLFSYQIAIVRFLFTIFLIEFKNVTLANSFVS